MALLALSVATLLVADDLRRVPLYCPFQGGCAAVTHSPWGKPLGIPLSVLGLAAFALFFGLTLGPDHISRFVGPAAVAAGVLGLLLVATQLFVLRRLCPLCLVVDGSAILLAAVALGLPPQPNAVEWPPGRWLWGALGLALVAVPLLASALQPPPQVPPEVRQTWLPGTVNVVEITDFTCPFCRQNHDALRGLREAPADGVRWTRFVAPGPHNEAGQIAARLYLCAVRQDASERMANILFATDSLAQDNVRNLAQQAGLDLARFEQDWRDEAIPQEVTATRTWVERSAAHGLPQVWVDDLLLLGAQSPESVAAALDRLRRQ